MRERIGEKAVVARDERFQAEQHLRERGENQQRQQNPKPHGRKKFSAKLSLPVGCTRRLKPAAARNARSAAAGASFPASRFVMAVRLVRILARN